MIPNAKTMLNVSEDDDDSTSGLNERKLEKPFHTHLKYVPRCGLKQKSRKAKHTPSFNEAERTTDWSTGRVGRDRMCTFLDHGICTKNKPLSRKASTSTKRHDQRSRVSHNQMLTQSIVRTSTYICVVWGTQKSWFSLTMTRFEANYSVRWSLKSVGKCNHRLFLLYSSKRLRWSTKSIASHNQNVDHL